ncbi:MAG: MotA/TolQ/ExbB proton channel family protein [Fimbriimonadaceae bacterium]|nr:MotA/TolQ/ExbB proton channel family protein [Fimbriimonadaceae bacterium]
MFALFREGGAAMWPLLACSVVAVAVILDRALYVLHGRCDRGQLLDEVTRGYRAGGTDEALAAAHTFRGPVARVVRHTLMSVASSTPKELHATVERMKMLQQSLLERRLYLLGTCGAVAPFIGLFGTVVGIQKAFADIAATKQAGIDVVGAGISEALVATAVGLGIGIVSVVAYNLLNNVIDKLSLDMDLAGDEVLSLLEAPREV